MYFLKIKNYKILKLKNISIIKQKTNMNILKFQNNQQTNLSKELSNLDSPFLMEIRRSEVKPCRAPSKNKENIFICFYLHFCLIFFLEK